MPLPGPASRPDARTLSSSLVSLSHLPGARRVPEEGPVFLPRRSSPQVRQGLKIAVGSKEGRGLDACRIRKSGLDGSADCFIPPCLVRVRQPDVDILRLPLDIAQALARQARCIENTPVFAHVAEGLGIRGIPHVDYRSTCAKPASFGLQKGREVIHETS